MSEVTQFGTDERLCAVCGGGLREHWRGKACPVPAQPAGSEKLLKVVAAQDAYILRLRQLVYAPPHIKARAEKEIDELSLASSVTQAKEDAGLLLRAETPSRR